jgi:hypothetical protein
MAWQCFCRNIIFINKSNFIIQHIHLWISHE